MPITTGTNTPAMRSASRAMGAFDPPACSTSRMICASVVSSPILSARNFRKPVLLIVAAATRLPGVFSTGMLSPVSALSSTAELPSSTTPSTGMRPPGRTSTTSPSRTCSTAICDCTPFRSTTAVFGDRSISRSIASPVLPLERVSRNFPSVTSVRIMPADSKYSPIVSPTAMA